MPQVTGQDKRRNTEKFDAEENHQEIVRGHQEDQAGGGQKQQGVIRAHPQPIKIREAVTEQGDEENRQQRHPGEHIRQTIPHQHLPGEQNAATGR